MPGLIPGSTQASPNTPNEYGIYPGDKNYASETLAAVSREQWEDYQNRFFPIEDMLFSMLVPGYVRAQGAEGLSSVGNTYQNSLNAAERESREYGLSYSPQEQQSLDRQAQLRQGLSEVDMYNRSAEDARNRQMGVLGGGLRQSITVGG